MGDEYDLKDEDLTPAPRRTAFGPTAGTPRQPRQPQPLGYAKSTYQPTEPVSTRGKVAVAFAGVLAALNLALVGLEAWDIVILNRLIDGTFVDGDDATYGVLALSTAGLYFLVAIGFMIPFFMWLYRAVSNVRIRTGDSQSGPGMSVGWWFIPIANLFMPYKVLADLWKRTFSDNSAGLVAIFWLGWIATSFVDRGVMRFYADAVENGDWQQAISINYASIGSSLVNAGLYVLLIVIVLRISRGQDEPETV